MKILTTGGHLTPSLAFIDFVTSQATTEFVFLGRNFSQIENRQRSQESAAVAERKIKFIQFQSGKLAFHSPLQLLTQIWLVALGLVRAIQILAAEHPDVVVLFGGYLAVPVAIASWIRGIPVITHEQTAVAGLSNQIIGMFSKKIAISYRSSQASFPQKKTVVTGNLLRPKLAEKNPVTPAWFTPAANHPVLYVTGGNQGSQVINTAMAQILPQLTRDWSVIHQCGSPTKKTNYRLELSSSLTQLSHAAQSRYFIREWITETELAWLYNHASVVISRAGANTVFELQNFGVPAILIPLPFSHKQEQLKNAELAAKSGGYIVVTQNHLTPDTLLAALKLLTTNLAARRKKTLQQNIDAQGTSKLWKLVKAVQTKTCG